MTNDAQPVTWISGAGSGVGQATAVAMARGRRLVLSGRRMTALEETARKVAAAGGTAIVIPCDAKDRRAVAEVHAAVMARWGRVDELVIAAGLNSTRRTWADQHLEDVRSVIETNLMGTINTIDAVLPGFREGGGGHVVVVSSYSAWRFAPIAGVAYSASKTALRSLCQTLNAEEAVHGVRACHLCPGDIDTDFLSLRPRVPDEKARADMLTAADVSRTIKFILDSPPHVRVDEPVISPLPPGGRREEKLLRDSHS